MKQTQFKTITARLDKFEEKLDGLYRFKWQLIGIGIAIMAIIEIAGVLNAALGG